MDNYSIDLFTKLDDFRFYYDNDNIYCHYLLMLFINEIFVENEKSDEIYLSLQENLKTTIDSILNYNNFNLDEIVDEEKLDYSNFNFEEIKDLLKFLNDINSILNQQSNYFLRNLTIIENLNNILNYFNEKYINEDLENFVNNFETKKDIDGLGMTQLLDDCKKDYLDKEYQNKININEIANSLSEIEEQKVVIINNNLNNNYLKEFYLRKYPEKYKCKNCGIKTWQEYPLPLFLHYEDKDNNNQDIENIYFLCPNCNSIFGEN